MCVLVAIVYYWYCCREEYDRCVLVAIVYYWYCCREEYDRCVC